jgi:RNA polymerase-binding transcription factor
MLEDVTAPTTENPLDDHFGPADAGEEGPGAAGAAGEEAEEETFAARSPEEAIDEVDHLLDAIEEALAALDDGSYGTCRACGSAIESSRLDADPLVRACGSCATG